MTVILRFARAVRSGLEWAGFWTAVAIPLGYLYLLYNGLTGAEFFTLAKLIGVHIFALVTGRRYHVESSEDESPHRSRARTEPIDS